MFRHHKTPTSRRAKGRVKQLSSLLYVEVRDLISLKLSGQILERSTIRVEIGAMVLNRLGKLRELDVFCCFWRVRSVQNGCAK